jgi:hypothetical protein
VPNRVVREEPERLRDRLPTAHPRPAARSHLFRAQLRCAFAALPFGGASLLRPPYDDARQGSAPSRASASPCQAGRPRDEVAAATAGGALLRSADALAQSAGGSAGGANVTRFDDGTCPRCGATTIVEVRRAARATADGSPPPSACGHWRACESGATSGRPSSTTVLRSAAGRSCSVGPDRPRSRDLRHLVDGASRSTQGLVLPMNHKRKRSKARRAGCLLCKPSKLSENKTTDRMRARRSGAGSKACTMKRTLRVRRYGSTGRQRPRARASPPSLRVGGASPDPGQRRGQVGSRTKRGASVRRSLSLGWRARSVGALR